MGKGFYAVLRGRQPGVYSSQWSAAAQVRRCPDSYQRGFDSRQEAEEWLLQMSGQRYPFYEACMDVTPSHHISPRAAAPPDNAIFLLQCDGASRGNPGPAGCGGCIWQPRQSEGSTYDCRWAHYQNYIGHDTNNVAEYRSLCRGLIVALGLGIRCIRVTMDSLLVVNQSYGNWLTRHPVMSFYRDGVQSLLHEFDWWELMAVPRDHNSIADKFANAAIDEQSDELVLLYCSNVNGDPLQFARQIYSKFQQHGTSPHLIYQQ